MVLLWLACARPPASPAEEPAIAAPPRSALWYAADPDGAIGVSAARAWYFHSDAPPYGVYWRDIAGAASPPVPIAGLNIIGQPSYWDPIPGGFLAEWDVPMRIDAAAGGGLSVGWSAPPGRWWDSHIVTGDHLIVARYDPSPAIEALSLGDGSVAWSSPLPREAQGMVLWADATLLYASWTQYDPEAPTPRILVPARVQARPRAGGAPLWTLDFDEHPGVLSATAGTVLVSFDAELRFIDGASGEATVVQTHEHPTIYPRVLAEDGVFYVALNSWVAAFGADGRERWRQPVPLDGGPALALAGDHLLVSTRHHSLVALDRASGAVAWEVGIGVSPYRVSVTDAQIVADGGSTTIGLTRPVNIPPEQATIQGRVTADCVAPGPVTVGTVAVQPDAEGRYSATVEAAGFVLVRASVAEGDLVLDEQRPLLGDTRVVTVLLDGSGTYTAPDLTIKMCE